MTQELYKLPGHMIKNERYWFQCADCFERERKLEKCGVTIFNL